MSHATAADRVRQIALVVGGAGAIVAAGWGSGAFGGTEIQNASSGALAATATPLAPGTGAFSVWSVIYLALIATAVLHALPSRAASPHHRALGWWVLASMVLNAAWICAAQVGLLGLTVPIIAALVAVLAVCLVRLRRLPTAPRLDAVVLGGTVGIYLGWVCVATVANVTAVLSFSDLDLGFLPEAVWVGVVLAVAALVCGGVALRAGRRTVGVGAALTATWGLAWIAVGRLTDGPDNPTAVVGALAAAAVVAVAGVVALVRGDTGPTAARTA
ncbi:tryptophan-rich sensory protein [Litorihabitans aurantiacus]|uniref:Tryptophan-rich sensory protein n=1 Tax=Litorihabitans aurantiacus TaxID=1930061 RepID=A0AA37ULL5_9MICO|nr:tryptophan-rich sensory protein [Litorihabitans aurantiacus]GMA30289.1 tryptophan-rich sensory protein [Litorihabitans aurantiacus]